MTDHIPQRWTPNGSMDIFSYCWDPVKLAMSENNFCTFPISGEKFKLKSAGNSEFLNLMKLKPVLTEYQNVAHVIWCENAQHCAISIPFKSVNFAQDQGFVICDPGKGIPFPIVFSYNQEWKFVWNGTMYHSKIQKSEKDPIHNTILSLTMQEGPASDRNQTGENIIMMWCVFASFSQFAFFFRSQLPTGKR